MAQTDPADSMRRTDPQGKGGQGVVDRRPIAARRLVIVRRSAAGLARAGVSPNLISVLGLVAAVLAGVLLVLSNPETGGWLWMASGAERGVGGGTGIGSAVMLLAAAVLIPFRLMCNLLDGLVAVEGGKKSALGEIFNEVPDRIADVAVLVGAGYVVGSSVTLGWCAACGALLVAYIRAVGKSLGFASDFRGPMAKQQRMVLVVIGAVGVALGPAEWRWSIGVEGPRGDEVDGWGVMGAVLAVICGGCGVTFVRRLWRLCANLRERAATAGTGA